MVIIKIQGVSRFCWVWRGPPVGRGGGPGWRYHAGSEDWPLRKRQGMQ